MATPSSDNKKLTVCVYLSGTRSQRAFTLLESLSKTPGFGTRWDVIIGIDCISYDLAHYTRSEQKAGSKATFIETKISVGKDRFLFSMTANVRSHYVLLLDDDVSLGKDWMSHLESFITDKKPTGMSGATIHNADAAHADRLLLHPSAILIKTTFLRKYEIGGSLPLSSADCTAFSDALTASLSPQSLHSESFDPRIFLLSNGLLDRSQPVDNASPLISICLCTYGDYPELVRRCLDSVLRERFFSKDLEILLGCNAASARVQEEIEPLYTRDRITTIIRSPVNINKSGIQRFTFRLSRGPYILSLDDDMYFKPGWLSKMRKCIFTHHPFEAAGRLSSLSSRLGWGGKKKPYHEFVVRKRWWRGKQPLEDNVHFPLGQCFLTRRSFVLENDYPDLGMKIDWDDVLLGDMVTQLDGNQVFFPDDLQDLIVVDEIASRGQHGGG